MQASINSTLSDPRTKTYPPLLAPPPPLGCPQPKFTPTVPARRKKAEGTGLGGVTAADAAAANEDFKDLIKAAEQSSTWQRGRGRGRGGVGRGGGQAQAFQVAFGGSTSDRECFKF